VEANMNNERVKKWQRMVEGMLRARGVPFHVQETVAMAVLAKHIEYSNKTEMLQSTVSNEIRARLRERDKAKFSEQDVSELAAELERTTVAELYEAINSLPGEEKSLANELVSGGKVYQWAEKRGMNYNTANGIYARMLRNLRRLMGVAEQEIVVEAQPQYLVDEEHIVIDGKIHRRDEQIAYPVPDEDI